MLDIQNRRYVGSKTSLVKDIYNIVSENIKQDNYTIADLFAGTGVVSSFFISQGKKAIMNDNLYSNFVVYKAWFGSGEFSASKIEKLVDEFNAIDPATLTDNYFSNIYEEKYFSTGDAKKIGYIRDQIESVRLTERERFILLAILLYATDKIANTVGHFEHYLSKTPVENKLYLRLLNLRHDHTADIFMSDANDLVRRIKTDVAYIDPPYNARQYVNFYHVLENLARWSKPTEFEGISMKFKRNHLKSEYSRAKAPAVLQDLINNLDAKLIIVSYNNTYSAKSGASNNKITEEQIDSILSSKGKIIERRIIAHKFFNAGKTDFKKHQEFLYACKVV